ncbi:MAG: PAS domain S-box protein [Deltaproteobacteria bacterium]|nr:PAS domain S-box protein [Deltaproteobacteria bacterium]
MRRTMAPVDIKKIFARIAVSALLVTLCGGLASAGLNAGDFPDRPRRILIIPSYNFDYKGIQWFIQGVMAELSEHRTFRATVSLENLQLASHPSDRKYLDTMAAAMKIKYTVEKPDLIIVQYKQALQFMQRYGADIFGDVPVVFAGLTVEGYIPEKMPRRYTGIISSFSTVMNIELILKNHPGVEKIYIIGGASPVERSLVSEAIAEGAPYRKQVELIPMTNMTFPALLKTLETLPDNSVVMYQALQLDAAGKVHVPAEAASDIARAARVPVYGMLDTYMGSGITGGFLIHHEGLGRRAAGIAVSWLQTGLAPDARVKSEPIGSYRFDDRQLKRWAIKEKSLPAGSRIEFKIYSVWKSYKKEIAGGIFLILAQTALIIVLLWNRRERIKSAATLKESEQYKSEILETMNETQHMALIGSSKWDLKTNSVWWSDENYRIFGVTPQNDVPEPEAMRKFIHPEDWARFDEALANSLLTGAPLDVEFRVVTGHGQLKCCRGQGKFVYDASGKPAKFIGTTMDITERRQSEQALMDSEELFRNLFMRHSAVKLLIDPQTGEILDANEAAEDFYGWTRKELVGMKIFDINTLAPEELKRAMETVEKQERFRFEYRHRRADGTMRDVEVFSTRIDFKGKRMLHSIVVDITDRKQAEEKILGFKKELEHEVSERTAELQRTIAQLEETNRIFVGRELKMVELKKRIEELERQ